MYTYSDVFSRKFRERGADREASAIKRRQRELIVRLRKERAQLQFMQEAYKTQCEKPYSFLQDKKKLLKEPNFSAPHSQNSELWNLNFNIL